MSRQDIYKYNPDRCTPEELDATFVAREGLLSSLLEELRARTKSPANQHFLIVGPRGIGKTNLLLLLRDRVASDKAFSGAYIPIRTSEEEYSIGSLRDFFGRVLDLLREIRADAALDAAAERIEGITEDSEAAEVAIATLKEYCRHSKRKILLLVDNLDLILGDQIGDDAEIGRLRDLLMNESFLVLVGASPTHFKEVSGYERPFYQFFKLLFLEDLSADQTAELIRKRAEWEGNRAILDRFDDLRPRLDAIYRLAGGNPRLALMLYQLHARDEFPEVETALLELLDELTPYFKARMEALSPQQRKVMDAFARLGRPATPTEIARGVRLPVNQVSGLLKRLQDQGFVTLAPQERRKTTLYMVSERLFRIWHQMRFSAEGRGQIGLLAEFILIWRSDDDWIEGRETALASDLGAPVTAGAGSGHVRTREGKETVTSIREEAPAYESPAQRHPRSLEVQRLVQEALRRCVLSVERRNFGDAAESFAEALAGAKELGPEGCRTWLVHLFRRIGRERNAEICSTLLDAARASGVDRQFGLLVPFAHAVEYWRKGKDAEVLDRLNPEVRQIVEQIVREDEIGPKPYPAAR